LFRRPPTSRIPRVAGTRSPCPGSTYALTSYGIVMRRAHLTSVPGDSLRGKAAAPQRDGRGEVRSTALTAPPWNALGPAWVGHAPPPQDKGGSRGSDGDKGGRGVLDDGQIAPTRACACQRVCAKVVMSIKACSAASARCEPIASCPRRATSLPRSSPDLISAPDALCAVSRGMASLEDPSGCRPAMRSGLASEWVP
jgi:hypothetical protein